MATKYSKQLHRPSPHCLPPHLRLFPSPTCKKASHPASTMYHGGTCACLLRIKSIHPRSPTLQRSLPPPAPRQFQKHTEGEYHHTRSAVTTMPKRRQLGIVALTSKVKTPAAILIRTSGVKLLLLKKCLWRRLLRVRSSLGGGRRRYSYAYYRQSEYEFSPSSTPLFGPPSRSGVAAAASRTKKLCGGSRLLYCLLCGAAGATLEEGTGYEKQVFQLEDVALSEQGDDSDIVSDEAGEIEEAQDALVLYSEKGEEEVEDVEAEEEDSVDNRAEKFIERFYENIRIQRQESLEQWQEMLQRSC